MSLAAASSVTPDPDRPGRHVAEIAPGWDIVGNANGGYLLALAARAGADAADGRLPVSITAHYLAPGKVGPIELDSEVLRVGGRFSTVRTTMADADRTLLAVLGTYAEIDPATPAHPTERVDASPPDMPSPDDCTPVEPTDTFPPPFMGKIELRLHPDDASYGETPGGTPRFRGWFRLHDEEPVDAFGLLVAVDAFPPTIFNAGLPVAWTPTVELTAHIRRLPRAGWLRCQFTTRFITGGFLEEDGEIWDDTGQLVAQSRQLAVLPRA